MPASATRVDSSEEWLTQPPLQVLVQKRLEEAIIAGDYLPGAHLVETELASRLGVSRGPIREALHQLQAQGWVDRRPRQGSFVHQPSRAEAKQFFQVRTLLEAEGALLAAQHPDPEVIERMRAVIEDARTAIGSADERFLIECNTTFHGLIHDLSRNPLLKQLTESLGKRMRWYFSPVATERAKGAWDEHEQLVDAIEARAKQKAKNLMRTHSRATLDALLLAWDESMD